MFAGAPMVKKKAAWQSAEEGASGVKQFRRQDSFWDDPKSGDAGNGIGTRPVLGETVAEGTGETTGLSDGGQGRASSILCFVPGTHGCHICKGLFVSSELVKVGVRRH
ncbi:hypothetical protein L1887_11281 [Cichorium endivia]|nr:hypothetical protein L1887_11281 [Cichorium endivia]